MLENTFVFDDESVFNKKARLSQKTICMISKQGNDDKSYYHYDVHSLYGHSQAFATNRYLKLDSIFYSVGNTQYCYFLWYKGQ